MRTELALVALAVVAMTSEAHAQCKVPGFDFAAFGDSGISMGNGNTDSYDSATGPYAATVCTTTPPCLGGVATNNPASGGISLGPNASVRGGCQIGAGGTTANITPNGNKCDAQSVQGGPLAMTIPTLPGTLTAAYGAVSSSLAIPSAGAYSMSSLSLAGNAALTVNAGPVVVYLTGSGNVLSLAGNAAVNNNTQLPSNLVFMCTSTVQPQNISIVGNGNAYYAIYCPNANITIAGNGTIYGSIVGKSVTFNGNNGYVHYDKALASFTSNQIACATLEVSRATPVVATIGVQDSVVQGTYEVGPGAKTTIASLADVNTFQFPYIKGHMRARVATSISTSASAFSSGTVLFDAGAVGKVPAPNNAGCNTFDGSCRNVFTVTQTPNANGTSFHPPRVQLNNGNASTIGALIAPPAAVPGIGAAHWQTIVQKVVAGKLGGVDRSTVAVIGASPIAGVTTRPTIAYFGGADGMLHAVCASVGGTTPSDANICPSLGTEIWAFMPRVQLPLVRKNMQRIDGSPRVVDVFGDFNNPATGTKSFRTILTFQTGYADTTIGAPGAVYALDVTDPANPLVIWEYTAPAAPAAFKLGTGLAIAQGSVLLGSQARNLVFAETSNSGTGGTGVYAAALDMETGVPFWQFGYAYPSPPRGVAADLPLPTTGIPGGAVAVDVLRSGYTTDIVMGDLYGNLWRLDAATGVSRTGVGVPLFQIATNKHPIGALPAIYSDGNQQFAVFGTGGYADPLVASWSAGTQSLLSVPLAAAGPFPINDNSPQLAFKENLTAGERVFGQVLVVGSEVFVTSDSTDVNIATFGTTGATGHAVGYNLTTSTLGSTIVTRGGAASLANVGTTLYNSSGDQQQELAQAALGAVGASVDAMVLPKLTRRLWLRLE